MFRYSSRIKSLPIKKINFLKDSRCFQSNQAQKNSGLGVSQKIIIAASGTAALSAGVIGYASLSNENQKSVENSIPGSKYVLDTILGPVIDVPQKSLPKTSTDTQQGLLKKKLDREAAEKENNAPLKPDVPASKPKPASEPTQTLTPPPVLPSPPIEEVSPAELPNKNIDPKLGASEEDDLAKNEDLSKLLQETMIIAHNQVSSALNSAEIAARAIHQYTERVYEAIDSGEGDEKLFTIISDVSSAKKEGLKTVEDQITKTKETITKLQKIISSGLKSNATKSNKVLFTAEEKVSELTYALSKINAIVADALRNSSAINEFQSLVLESRRQFESEVKALMPEVKLGEKSDKLTVDELNLLLAHAHRKVLAVQRALAKQHTLDKGRFKDSLLRQREQEANYLQGILKSELEKQRHSLTLEYKNRLQQIKDDNENEMRLQLKRQAAAHSDHLADVLLLQEQELERKWKNIADDEVQKASDAYNKSLLAIDGQLKGLKDAIATRAKVNEDAHSSHELWMACESLKTALRLGKSDAISWEERLLPLQNRVKTIKDIAGEDNIFVNTVLTSIPEEAQKRGVYTRDALREKFLKVERICQRVSMIGDNGGSLIKYLLSYIQSFLVVKAFEQLPDREVTDQEINVDSLSTYDILDRARYCLEKDDLIQAIRYMNLLRGESHHVASDWIKEARLTLEAHLAAEALMAHAAAIGARAL